MKGERGNNHAAKLTRTLVREIREKYISGAWTQGSLARSYGVSVVQIGRIVRGESWGDMLAPAPPPPDPQAMLERLLKVQAEVDGHNADQLDKEKDNVR